MSLAALALTVLVALLLGCPGCRVRWTDFEYVNLSDEKISVEVQGISPDPSPGVMGVSDSQSGTRAGLHFGEEIKLDDTITITWTVEDSDSKQEMEFERSTLGIPERVNGGVFTMTYTSSRTWEVSYSRR